MLRQSRNQLAAIKREVRSDVQTATHRILSARKMVDYYDETVIPLHEEIVAAAQKEYNYMLKGVYFLLEAKQEELVTRRSSTEALRDYWIARTELERSIGSQLPVTERSVKPLGELPAKDLAEDNQPPEILEHHHSHGGMS